MEQMLNYARRKDIGMMRKLVTVTGFSLLEVLVSMLILAFGILGLAPLVTIAIYNNSYSGDLTEANNIARTQVETLLNQNGYGQLPLITMTDSVQGVYQVTNRVDDNSTNAAVPAGVYRVDVIVKWQDDQNIERTIEVASLKPIF